MFRKKLVAALLLLMFATSCVGTDFIQDPIQLFEPKIEIEPANSAIRVGENIDFAATYYDSLGQQVQSTVFQWTSSNSDVAVIDANGTASGTVGAYVISHDPRRARVEGAQSVLRVTGDYVALAGRVSADPVTRIGSHFDTDIVGNRNGSCGVDSYEVSRDNITVTRE